MAIAHIRTEEWLEIAALVAPASSWSACFDSTVVCGIHAHLFSQLPENTSVNTPLLVSPGVLRTQGVSVGQHAAPAFDAVPVMLAR